MVKNSTKLVSYRP